MVKNASFDYVIQGIKQGRMIDMQIKKENGVYIIYLVKCNNSVKEILTSPVTLISVSLAGAVVVPTVCLITERRKNA